MEKIFIYARMVDVSHEIDIRLKRIKRMRQYPSPKTERIMIDRSTKVVQIGFELLRLRSEAINLVMQARQPIFPEGGVISRPVNVKDASDALRFALLKIKKQDEEDPINPDIPIHKV